MLKYIVIFKNKWIYRFRTWVLIMLLLRFAFIFIYHKANIGLGPGTLDYEDYYVTAENVANWKGFISPESNLDGRAYLGDNYYFASEPGYVLFLLIFLPNKIDHLLITLVSNSLLYILIMWLIWKSFTLLSIHKKFYTITMILLLVNPHIIHYSLRGSPELLRMAVVIAMFYYFLLISRTGLINRSQILFLGILGGFSILVRMTFIMIPFFLLPLVVKYSNEKLISVIIYISSIFIVLMPWVYRNYHDFGLITIDHRLTHSHLEVSDIPKQVDLRKYKLAFGTWRITDNDRWWKLRNEKDADNLNIMLSNIDDKPAQWLKMYGLIGWELFKPFPQGGKLIRIMQSTIFKSFDPFLSKLILQTYSLIINIPWLVGFILFSLGIIKDLKPLWFWFSIGFFSFICAHLLSNNPHSRYMLPLLPVGYIAFFTFFNSNMNFKMKSGQ